MDRKTTIFYQSFIKLKILINKESLKINKFVEENKFDKEELDQFKNKRERQYLNFQKKLMINYPSLNTTEIRFCAYLWYNSPNNLIKKRLHLNKREIKEMQCEIKRKMKLTKEIELGNYLKNI